MQCSQCEKPAIRQIDNHPLCVDHSHKMQEVLERQEAQYARHINYLTTEMEVMTGLSGVLPRHELPKTPIQTGPVTLHNISIDRSIIGAVNMGNIQKLDVAIDHIKNGGDSDLVEELKKFTAAVMSTTDVQLAKKNAIIEHLAHLSQQVATPRQARQNALVRTVIEGLERLVNFSASLITHWQVIRPLLERQF